MPSASERREALKAVYEEASGCVKCPLSQSRTRVVFGAGNADAELMLVGEAPGANEDRMGLPFVGQAGKLLDKLLGEIGLAREDVFVANVLKCLRYTAMVQLGDGTWERIGRLVRSRYDGCVMSVDEEGRLVPRRVTGWHATPVGGRSVYHLTYRSAERAGLGGVGVEVTGDHPVLTERGYVPVQELRSTDRIATGQGLSALARDVACGSLLGDASIRMESSSLTLSHSSKQVDHARFKAALLAELRTREHALTVTAVAGGERADDILHVRTLAHRALRTLRHEFYRPHKVVPRWIEEQLNARMLAVWFMDDGCTRLRPPRQPLSEIATLGFSDADLQVLLRGLMRLGLSAKASRSRLYFDVGATQELSRVIAPFVPPSMRHKLHPDIEAQVPFDPGRLEPGPPVVMYDEVDIENVTARPRGDVTFFCIDVEGTHNFVTAGGVVHNCRPPQNRDPQPREIETCQPYLRAQVELIEPRVVCTLGNFATKLLRGDSTGISRLHGREEVQVLGARAVWLYPLFHPAAALYTRAMLQTLREDVARLPALLARPAPPSPAVPEPVVEPAALATAEGEAGALETAQGEPEPEHEPERESTSLPSGVPAPVEPPQLGLF